VRAGRPGIFGSEAVADGYYGEGVVRGHIREVGILTVKST
jgi:hypothetical protein